MCTRVKSIEAYGNNDKPMTSQIQEPAETLVKSKQRVADHGEVFTPGWLVEDMLNLVKDETERIDSRFLEPACGSGNFLIPVLARKLASVQKKYGRSDFEKRHFALVALMSVYGIELLADNVAECRENLLALFADFLNGAPKDVWRTAGAKVLAANIVHGDALTLRTQADPPEPILFPEWAYLGKGKYQRRDFRYDTLTQMSSFAEDTLFGEVEKHDIFVPVRDYAPMTVEEIGA